MCETDDLKLLLVGTTDEINQICDSISHKGLKSSFELMICGP